MGNRLLKYIARYLLKEQELHISSWGGDRVVFTTEEWNSFKNNNAISFKIKLEANEGIWVEEPLNTIESCPDCKFMYHVIDPRDSTTWLYTTWNTSCIMTAAISNGSIFKELYTNPALRYMVILLLTAIVLYFLLWGK